MSKQNCGTCAELAKVIQKQQAEILKLKSTLAETKGACDAVIGESNKVLTGNQPRGTWSYARGAKETAEKVLKRLKGV